MTKQKMVRNLIIFSIVAVGGGFIGIVLDRLSPPADRMQGLGALVWLVSPLLANLLLRWLGKDGWKDFGFNPRLRSGWVWYLAAVAIAPLVTLPVLGLGTLFGAVSLTGLNGLWAVLGAVFAGSAVKNIFEEFAWRGYLTPRFEALGLHPFLNALLTGLVWTAWHIPYYLYYLDPAVLAKHTSLSVPVFILVAFLIMPLHALLYGELRLLSKSVWTTWLLHTVANAVGMGLVSGSFAVLDRSLGGVIFSPGTEGIVYTLLMGLIGLGLYRYRMSRAGQGQPALTPAVRHP